MKNQDIKKLRNIVKNLVNGKVKEVWQVGLDYSSQFEAEYIIETYNHTIIDCDVFDVLQSHGLQSDKVIESMVSTIMSDYPDIDIEDIEYGNLYLFYYDIDKMQDTSIADEFEYAMLTQNF